MAPGPEPDADRARLGHRGERRAAAVFITESATERIPENHGPRRGWLPGQRRSRPSNLRDGVQHAEDQPQVLRVGTVEVLAQRSATAAGLTLLGLTEGRPQRGKSGIALPTTSGRIVCDLIALRSVTDDCFRPIVIELKSERQIKRLMEQVESYAALVEEQLVGFQSLASALLERQLTLVGPCERWIVWPALAHHAVDPREAELARQGIRVVTYRQQDNRLVLRAGAGPKC